MSSVLVFLKKIPNAQAYKTLFGSAKERFIQSFIGTIRSG